MSLIRSCLWVLLLPGLLGGFGFTTHAQNPEPAGWYTGDMHVHRSCGGSPVSLTSIRNAMSTHDLAIVSLLADMGNGEVQNPATDLPKVNGQNDPASTSTRTIHWDAEWHWDATYNQFAHQALGGHIVALGLSSATQVWEEYTKPIFDWAHARGGIAGFAHMQYLDDSFPQSLTCCTPVEYPVEVALGACDFISEDVGGSDTAMRAYYRLLNCGFRPGFAAGSDYPCNAQIGALLTYVRVSGTLTYRKWVDGIAAGRTVVSRNGHNEFLDLKVNNTATPGDEIQLTGGGTLPVTVVWTAKQNLSGTIELVQNGVVVASKTTSVTASTSQSLTATVNFTSSGWLAARRMDSGGHQLHTAAVFVKVNNAPIRASAADANFYVQWMDQLIQRTSPGGVWSSYFPNNRAAAQARYQAARSIYQQIAAEEASQPLAITTTSLPNGLVNLAYSTTLLAVGGTSPFKWSLASGSLPAGLTLNTNTGVISGTPTTTGSSSFTVRVTDLSSPVQTTTKALGITVNAAAPTGIFGNTVNGTTTDYIWFNGPWINAGRFLAASNMTVSTMQAKVGAISGKYKCAIYADNGGQPGGFLASTLEVGNPATGWQTFPLTTPLTLTSGSYYWLAIWSDNANAQVYYSGTGGTLRWQQIAYGNWPNPMSTGEGGNFNYCIYASGTATPTPTLTSITVTPANSTITAGSSQQFTATGNYSSGGPQNITSQAAWNSSSTSVATINSSGLATGNSGGGTTISATLNGVSGNTTLTVQVLDTTRPTVTSVSPAAGATGVSLATTVRVTFSEAMAAATINTTTFSLRNSSGTLVAGSVTYDAATRTATLTPASSLSSLTTYTATAKGGSGGVTDAAGNSLAGDFVWSFTTLQPDTTPPVVNSVSPLSGANGVSRSASVTATFNEAMNASTINSNTFTLLDSLGNVVASTISYTGSTFTAVLKPNNSLQPSGTYATGVAGGPAGVKDVSGNALSNDFIWSFTTTNTASYSIWSDAAVPAVLADSDTSAVELGLKFRSAVAGFVTGIRFYKSSSNTGTHVGKLWTSTGTLLATVTFANETASGWQTQMLPTRVAVNANTTYVVSYRAPVGRYSVNVGYFTSSGVTNQPLRALSNAEGGGNGVYRYGASAFPNQTWNASHYWVDVVFEGQ